MVKLTIDNTPVEVPEDYTILDAAKSAGIPIPTLCYLKDINEIGACRICVVEVEGVESLVASCNNCVQEGMVVHTHTPRVIAARRSNVQFLLSQHDTQCTTCVRSGSCRLQALANDLNIIDQPYQSVVRHRHWDNTFPLIRDESKCIQCMRCVHFCEKVQNMKVWQVLGSSIRLNVNVTMNQDIRSVDCSLCGQCITHCPTGALRERDDTIDVYRALLDPDVVTVVQVAPAVRAAWAESFGIPREQATPGKLAAALRSLGFDYVFDTNFAADLTIMEEGSEFIERFTHREEHAWPMFTSCCPGWLRFARTQYPELMGNLSSAKSPQQMFGAVAKRCFAGQIGVDPKKLFVVSIMPCTAKKFEAAMSVMGENGEPDVNVVLTTREFVRMLRGRGIDIRALEEEPFDSPLGSGTGAAVIFGATGGVMDAALRSASYLITGKNPDPDAFVNVRGLDGWKQAEFAIEGAGTVRVAVASGLGNARKLIEALKKGEVEYDFVEIMACPGGCAGGGGQPIHAYDTELAGVRGDELWRLDRESELRFSHENPDVQALYTRFLDKPLSEKAHHILHIDQESWSI